MWCSGDLHPMSNSQQCLLRSRKTLRLTALWLTNGRIRPVKDIINIRSWNGELQSYSPGVADNGLWQALQCEWNELRWRCKMMVSVGAVLEYRKSGELRPRTTLICLSVQLWCPARPTWVNYLPPCRVDLCDVAAVRHPSMSWKVPFVINVAFYLGKMVGAEFVEDTTDSLYA